MKIKKQIASAMAVSMMLAAVPADAMAYETPETVRVGLESVCKGASSATIGTQKLYIGMEDGVPMCVEAKGIDYGVIKSRVSATNWQYGLTFSDMEYNYDVAVFGVSKKRNPYVEPTHLLQKGMKGNDVKWLQWELRESGFDRPFEFKGKSYGAVLIDGDFGKITDAAARAFQASCKIAIDGKVGSITRTWLKG